MLVFFWRNYFELYGRWEFQKYRRSMARLLFLSVLLLFIQPGEAQKNVDMSEYLPSPLLWYEEPWVWVVAAFLILLGLVLLLFRGNNK